MARKTEAAPTGGRQISAATSKPAHLASRGGAGRSREATEFDELVPEWFESGEWFKIEAEGDDDAAKLEDVETVFKAVAKAVAYHNYGVDRLKEDDPSKEGFSSYGVWVHVRERQARGPEKGSIKDPESGKRVGPSDETGRYQELVEMRENGEI